MLVSPRIQFTDAFPYASPHRGTVSYGYPAAFSVVFFKTNSCVCCVLCVYLYIVLSMIHLSRVSSERRKRRRCVERRREREKTTVKNAFGSQIYIYIYTAKYSFAPASGEI